MEEKKIRIVQATQADAPFVAKCVCMALHHELSEEELVPVAAICSRTDVLYSYRFALIALVNDKPAGLCLCYDGADYHEMRRITFPLFSQGNEEMDLDNAQDEAVAGEYYMDSLAVLPEYRRMGLGRTLMLAHIDKARQMGFKKATLLVDPDNPSAQHLYKSIGFTHQEDCYAFGQIFWKWSLPL